MSAPTGKPVWVNPCGGKELAGADGSQGDTVSDLQLLTRIIIASKNALAYAKQFSQEYVITVFPGSTLFSHHELWKDSRYDWLPSEKDVPKSLGEPTPEIHLKQFPVSKLNDFLIATYRHLQTLSVGLEQTHHDKTRHNAMFAEEFAQTQYKLRQVLCEVESALTIRAPEIKIIDVLRSVMSEEYRIVKDKVFRDMRDWIIFRDVMNNLEYVIDVCEELKNKINASEA